MQNHKNNSLKIVLLLIAVITLMFSACSNDDARGFTVDSDGIYRKDDPVALAIIFGNHANAMSIPEDAYQHIADSLEDVVYGGYACVITADSTPTKVDLSTNDPDMYLETARNTTTLRDYIESRCSILLEAIKQANVPADSPEVDLLQAIREAVNALNNSSAKGIANKKIIIVDTGICTYGDLDFTQIEDLISHKPNSKTIIDQLQKQNLLPNLEGFTVTFIGTNDGLAEVAEPQILDTQAKQYLRELWGAVVTACGAKNVEFLSAAGWNTANKWTGEDSIYPYVAPVTFVHEDIFPLPPNGSDDGNNEPSVPNPPKIEIEFEAAQVAFRGDSADYLNAAAAEQFFYPYAVQLLEYLEAYPSEDIWLFGTTASVNKAEGSPSLSMDRALKVKNTLVSLNIPSDRIHVVGLGAVFPWYDTNPTNIQSNRSVWLLTATDEEGKFQHIMQEYEKGNLLPETMDWIAEVLSAKRQ